MNLTVTRTLGMALLVGACLSPAAAAGGGGASDGTAVTRAADGFAADGPEVGPRAAYSLVQRSHEAGSAAQGRRAPGTVLLRAGEGWIHSASVRLFDDRDGDGYHTYLRVRVDADSLYSRHHVYAVLLLSADGVYWEDLHITDDFLIRGTSPHDLYEIDVELRSGYPTGRYDLLIELYDADRGLLLDVYGPAHSPEFSLLPLEDLRHDRVAAPHVHDGGGGATGWGLPLLAALALFARRLAHSRVRAVSPEPRGRERPAPASGCRSRSRLPCPAPGRRCGGA